METNFQTQKQWVKEQLKSNGFITRNQCLRNYISRLGAIIYKLKEEGMKFETDYIETETKYGKGKDFKYTLIEKQKTAGD